AWIAIGILQPILYLTLFAPLLKSLTAVRGFPPGGAYNVFVPGQLIMLGLFGASGVGFGLIAELRLGVIERFRVTPVSRLALLLGSGGLLPMSLAPAWLRDLAVVNPLGYAVDAGRALFLDHVGDVSVVKGLAIMAALALVAVTLAARSVGRAVA